MTSGRGDYWYGMLPGKASLGLGQSDWLGAGAKTVASGGSEYVIEYNVPVNYRLNIVGGMVSCVSPGINSFILYMGSIGSFTIYFDLNITLPFSPAGTYVLESGEVAKIRLYNRDDIENRFYFMLFGFLEYKVV